VKRKRQWGTERQYGGSPVIAETPGKATVGGARFALFFTAAAWLAYVAEQLVKLGTTPLTPRTLAETLMYLVLVTLLTGSAAAYLLARLGYFERMRNHRRVPRSIIDDFLEHTRPSLTVIVPSYREDERVIRQTLLSAALQEYPDVRIVLLIDDPPNPGDEESRLVLQRARALPRELMAHLSAPCLEFERALETFEHEVTDEQFASATTLHLLAEYYEVAAGWFERESATMQRIDHTDEFLAIEVFDRLRADLQLTATAIREAANEGSARISRRRVHQLYLRLARTFKADISSFERKQFASLSHEANKAMNLNSYLGLMGGRFNIVSSPGGRVLVPAGTGIPELVVPDSDYVLTLDADSILLPEYCLRLVHFMEQEENSDVAVVQTPYSAYRGASSRIERIAGATTDIQHIVHQGLTHYGATFWVGANAIIRKRALDELEEREDKAGFVIKRYIQDRTVIEDTESSIDLRARGWRLHNYPERLSYSATPPDFGSMVIQRQRWANGGLVILPGLFRMIRRRNKQGKRPSMREIFLRLNYLGSITSASVGLLILLFYPFEGQLLSRYAVLTAVPYFWMLSGDLSRIGYRRSDLFRVYGFNLLLLPINLVGTVQSVVQAIGGQKINFARTPKVSDRTVAPLMFVVMPLLLIGWSAWTLRLDIQQQNYMHGAFSGTNLILTGYACIAFVGVRPILADIFVNLRAFIYKPTKATPPVQHVPHWASVLYIGSSVPEEVTRSAPLAVALAAQDQVADQDRPSIHAAARLGFDSDAAVGPRNVIDIESARIVAADAN
jgi:cellulose synthase/poly-beta-1,6-N-acetylglucosamine synthase-like glycosyltransferase